MYYKLNELENLVQLKPRSLKLRMKKVKLKYQFNPNLLYKEGNRWYIHRDIVFEFDRKRKNLNHYNFKSFVSVSFEGSRGVNEINQLMTMVFDRLKNSFPKLVIYYVIELNWMNNNHVHFLTNIEFDRNNQRKVYKSFEVFIINFDMRKITNYRNLNNYLNKGFITKKLLS